MDKDTTQVRIRKVQYKQVKAIAERDRRTITEVLAILLEKALRDSPRKG